MWVRHQTRTALITFQRKEGFEANGRIDTRTVTALGLEGKVKVKSESSTSSSSSQSPSTTSQSTSGAQKSDEKGTTGQAPPVENAAPSEAQKNATPDKGPSEQKGSNNAQPTPTTPKDQQSRLPAVDDRSGQQREEPQPGMSVEPVRRSLRPRAAKRQSVASK